MSFCGFITFSNAPDAVEAEQALRRWIGATAASADVRDWTDAASRGCFATFSLVHGAAHHAALVVDPGPLLVGDVPESWLTGVDGEARRGQLDRANSSSPLDAVIPDIEFAMGLWNGSSSRLTLYRCPAGARALFYVCSPRRWIAFASLPEPLLALPGVRDEIDEATLPSLLFTMSQDQGPHEATVFTRLRRLPPAHRLRFTPEGFSVDQYWRFPDAARTQFGNDDPEVPRALRRLLDDAVRRRITGIERVGTQLSGGLDSSAVTALADAQRDENARLFTYTLQLHDPQGALVDAPERTLARALTSRLPSVTSRDLLQNKAHRPFYLFQSAYADRPLPDMVFRLNADHRMCAAARRDGCGVLLSGWGGDEMASARGSQHVLAMLAERRWKMLAENLFRRGSLLGPLRAIRQELSDPLWTSMKGRTPLSGELLADLERVVAGRRLQGQLPSAPFRENWSPRPRRRARLARRGFHVSLEVHDWLGQRYGVPIRHPLLDRHVLEFCDSMPAEWIGHRGVKRRAFRAALSDILPAEQFERVKAPLPLPANNERWRRRYQAHQHRALRDLAASGSWLDGYLSLEMLARLQEAVDPSTLRSPIHQLSAQAIVLARLTTRAPER